jgi:hypothetical protein
MAPGVPVKPMLARACSSPGDALRLLGPGAFLAEHKYDGQRAQVGPSRGPGARARALPPPPPRPKLKLGCACTPPPAQVHMLEGGAVRIFSRNCEERTQVGRGAVGPRAEAWQAASSIKQQ